MKQKKFFLIVVCISLCFSMTCGALEFEALINAPTPAPGASSLAVKTLPNGCLLIWDGNTIYRQPLPQADVFNPIATGYAGDPGFMAVSPDGHTVLLAAGLSKKLYVLDLNEPAPYSPAREIAPANYPSGFSQYWGVFLTDSMVLLDSGNFVTDELGVFDLHDPAAGYRAVMQKPATLAPGESAASATVAIDQARTTVYAMSYVFDSMWNSTAQLKRIPAAALIQAFQASSTLNWDTDATAIGGPNDFFTSGPAEVMENGHVLVGGTGGVQRVNPASETVVQTYAPFSDPMDPWHYNYTPAYNPVTGDIMLIVTDWHTFTTRLYVPQNTFGTLPVWSMPGALALLGALIVLGRRKLR
ncbi:MAG TPA: hypothetical protein P5318_13305 [Candidatus Hydrogenedentes bacterium]|nr:hypothetical protein [Candidatus Hydrogenedentota bacterium]HRT21096.1 hypothetical protein [Candidatus Hydrogenedentota bacterium]HRT66031.1 hypothetical protein [Candidatus Hydrogenedentota bacterium]